ncbi:hypothetical protein ANO14919_053840 [Xylariales sp. No.14919]|nr:hypothetical protein ANO14919_053840 [Xylariales sp. No.14919]
MRNLLCASNNPNLVDSANLGAETSVNAKNLAVNNSSEH